MDTEAHRRGLPPWDRTIDAIYHTHPHNTPPTPKATHFTASLDAFFHDHNHPRSQDFYFCLPDNIRLLICLYLLAPHHEDKPIRLNKHSFNRDVWRENDFQSLCVAFEPLRPYLAVSFAFRADALLTFLAENTFHATFSPYVGHRINPLATKWLNKYGPYMQSIAVEVDMTRLGYGPSLEATNFVATTSHIEALLQKFVKAQLRRRESQPLDNLILLCRRFYGERTTSNRVVSVAEASGRTSAHSRRSDKSGVKSLSEMSRRPSAETRTASPALSLRHSNSAPTGTPDLDDDLLLRNSSDRRLNEWPASPLSLNHQLEYCPDADLVICNHLLRLRNRVKSLRMCGFSEAYTTQFIATLFPDVRVNPEQHTYRVTPSTVWPRLSGQKSYVDIGDGCLTLGDHDAPQNFLVPVKYSRWEGCVQLPPPLLDSQGIPSLPPGIATLQHLRAQSIGRTSTAGGSQRLSIPALPVQSSSDRRRIMKLLEKYGKTGARRKRTLTREVATTL